MQAPQEQERLYALFLTVSSMRRIAHIVGVQNYLLKEVNEYTFTHSMRAEVLSTLILHLFYLP